MPYTVNAPSVLTTTFKQGCLVHPQGQFLILSWFKAQVYMPLEVAGRIRGQLQPYLYFSDGEAKAQRPPGPPCGHKAWERQQRQTQSPNSSCRTRSRFKKRSSSRNSTALEPKPGSRLHLWDVKLGEVLVAAVRVLATSPVAVHEVMLLPEER